MNMKSWKLLLFQLFIVGLVTSGFAKPSEELRSRDYSNDEADYENDDISDQTTNLKQINSVDLNAPKAYFKLSDYTETVKIGDNVTLKCDVANTDEHTVFLWFKESIKHLIYQADFRVVRDDRFILLPDHSLTIVNVKDEDKGDYHCRVLPAEITMNAKLVITDRSITYRENERIEVECKASGIESSKIEFKWSADGNRLSSDDFEIDGGRLVIKKAGPDHVRVYQCLADDGSDAAAHATVNINIQYIPRVSVRKAVVNTKEGDDAELYCDFETSSESRVIWLKDDKILPISTVLERSKYSMIYGQPKGSKSNSILVVNKVKSTDLATYKCKVENNIGTDKTENTIQLTFVPEPPHLQKIETDGKYTITHWHIRSLQPLTEVMLQYRQKDAKTWNEDSPIDKEQSKEHSGLWKIRHKIALEPGHWHAIVKAKNSEGWSQYSNQEDLIVNEPTSGSSTLMTISWTCIVLSILSIYSINISA